MATQTQNPRPFKQEPESLGTECGLSRCSPSGDKTSPSIDCKLDSISSGKSGAVSNDHNELSQPQPRTSTCDSRPGIGLEGAPGAWVSGQEPVQDPLPDSDGREGTSRKAEPSTSFPTPDTCSGATMPVLDQIDLLGLQGTNGISPKPPTNFSTPPNSAKAATVAPTSGLNQIHLFDPDRANQISAGITLSVQHTVSNYPVSHTTDISEYDIELDDLSSPMRTVSGTYSTTHLIHSSSTSLVDNLDQTLPGAISTKKPPPTARNDATVLNYKPLTLRWPYAVLLLSVIAAFFAFLEYESHHLPSVGYSILEEYSPGPQASNHHRAYIDHPDGTTLPPEPLTPMTKRDRVTKTYVSTLFQITRPKSFALDTEKMIKARTAAPEPSPSPDPRPPATIYPKPLVPRNTFCGWSAPWWRLETFVSKPDGWCDHSPGDCDIYVWVRFYLQELIDTYITNDTSWCPCTVWDNGDSDLSVVWSHAERVEMDGVVWDTTDPGCRSAMVAVESMNYYKGLFISTELQTTIPGFSTYSVPRGYESVVYSRTTLSRTTLSLTSPPEPIGVGLQGRWLFPSTEPTRFWDYASTDSSGNIIIPMVYRAASMQTRDTFGNKVKATDSAFFPNHFTPVDDILSSSANPCFYPNEWWEEDCTEKPEPSTLSTSWWVLPLSRPANTSIVPTPPAIITTSSGNASTTSTAAPQSSIVSWQPTSTRRVTESSMKPDGTVRDSSTVGASSTLANPSVVASSLTLVSSSTMISSLTLTRSSTMISSTTQTKATTQTTLILISGLPQVITGPHTFVSSQTTSSSSATVSIPESIRQGAPLSFNSGIRATLSTIISIFQQSHSFSQPAVSGTGGATGKATTSTRATDTSGDPIATSESRSLLFLSPSPTAPTSNFSASFETVFTGAGTPNHGDVTTESLVNRTGRHGDEGLRRTSDDMISGTGTDGTLEKGNRTSNIPFSSVTSTRHPSPKPSVSHRPPRPGGPGSPKGISRLYNLRSEIDFIMVSVVPTLLATILLVLLQVSTNALNSMMPYRALGYPQGAAPSDSLCLSRSPNVLFGPSISMRFLRHFKDPLPLLGMLLSVLATVLVALSSEVIRLDMTTSCEDGSGKDRPPGRAPPDPFHPLRRCAYGLRKSGTLIRIAEGLLIALSILVIAITVLLWRWKSGLASDPWSIASVASMVKVDGELQTRLKTIPTGETDLAKQIPQSLEGRRYRLEFSPELRGTKIEVVPTSKEDNTPIRATVRKPPNRKAIVPKKAALWTRLSHMTLELVVRLIALLFTTGLLIIILHYETAVGVTTGFETFMNSQTIGVRVLFAAFGTTINAFWNYYFSYSSEFQIHTTLAKAAQPARTSILLSPPSNVFVGLYDAIRLVVVRHITAPNNENHPNVKVDILSLNITLATLLAKFLPVVLANIPFSNVVTFKIHEVCTWISVAVLVHMGLVLLASVLLPIWRRSRRSNSVDLPARSDTIATHMFYICDSYMLMDLDSLSGVRTQKRDRVVSGMNKLYGLGEIRTGDGQLRIGVDYRCATPVM